MNDSDAVTGIAWYRRDHWTRLRELASDADKLEESYDDWLAGSQKTLIQRKEGFNSIGGRDENDDGNRKSRDVLLVLQILICRQEGVEVISREPKELAIFLACPAHGRNSTDFVPGQ